MAGDVPHAPGSMDDSNSKARRRKAGGSSPDARISEAYVTLGRLSHVKMRHEQDADRMQALLAEQVKDGFASAMEKVRGEFDALKENLDRLYQKSVADLEAHKMVLERPTRARLELIEGHKTKVGEVENRLKALVTGMDERHVSRDLPVLSRTSDKLLSASVKLIGLPFPKANRFTAEDFPDGRLHNLIIAPKRSGDRGRRASVSSASSNSTSAPKNNQHLASQAAPGGPAGRGVVHGGGGGAMKAGRPRGKSESERGSSESERGSSVPPAVHATTAAAPGRGCFGVGRRERRRLLRRVESLPDVIRDDGRGAGAGVAGAAEACRHCACACHADDVWAAYRTLRKRYNALKEQADVEEIRVRVEERRRELQVEFDGRRKKMEKDLGLSRAEMHSLRNVVQASVKECEAIQRESAELREKVLVGERRLEEARQAASTAIEEVARRKQHGHLLLARIRYLKGQTAACVNRTANAPESGYTSPVDSDYGSDSDMEEILRRRNNHREEQPCAPCYDGDTPSTTNTTTAAAAENDRHEDVSESVGQGDNSGESRGIYRQGSYGRAAAMRDRGDAAAKEWCMEWERKHVSLKREVKKLSDKLASASSFDAALSDEESTTCTDSTRATRTSQRPPHSPRKANGGNPSGNGVRSHFGGRGVGRGMGRGNAGTQRSFSASFVTDAKEDDSDVDGSDSSDESASTRSGSAPRCGRRFFGRKNGDLC